jgi:hypothetical protein
MKPFTWAGVVTLLIIFSSHHAQAAELSQLEADWHKGLERIRQEYDAKLAKRHESYEEALKELAKRSQDEGDLDATLAIKKELGRYESERSVSAEDVVEKPIRLKQLQDSWIQLHNSEMLEDARQTIALGERYGQALAHLQKTFTRDGKLDEAVKVREVRESLASLPEVSEARFVIAEMSRPTADATRPARQVRAAGPRIVETREQEDSALLFHVPFDGGRDFLMESTSRLALKGEGVTPVRLSRGRVAGEFTGANAGVSLPDAKLIKPFPASRSGDPGSFTLSAWINRRQLNKRDPILAKQANETRGFVLMIEQSNSLAIEIFADNSNDKATRFQAPQAIETDKWYHVAASYQSRPGQGSVLCLFIDGEQRGKLDSAIGPLHVNGEDVTIGRYTWNQAYSVSFDGLLDDIRVYDGALPAEEIKALFLKNQR